MHKNTLLNPITSNKSTANRMEDIFDKSKWTKGLFLGERAKAITGCVNEHSDKENVELFERWTQSTMFKQKGALEKRLKEDGLTLSDFENIVVNQVELNLDNVDFSWLDTIKDAFNNYHSVNTHLFNLENSSLIKFCKPILSRVCLRLEEKLNNAFPCPVSFETEKAIRELSPILLRRVYDICSRVIVLYMHEVKKAEGLKGETPEERFQYYIDLLSEPPRAIKLLNEYPVMARMMIARADQWADMCFEFLSRMEIDHSDISNKFSVTGEIGRFEGLLNATSDSHNGGRCVLIPRFSSGLIVVYKPRPLVIDEKFNALLQWINNRVDIDLKIIEVLDKTDYGWAEHIKPKECNSREEASRYYFRLGGLLACLHCLQGTDFHNENIIAGGDQPVLIDLETVVHPIIPEDLSTESKDSPETYPVERTGLVPFLSFAGLDKSAKGVDISGISGKAGQPFPTKSKIFIHKKTDEMIESLGRTYSEEKNNRPRLQGVILEAKEYKGKLIEGFESVYYALLNGKDELTAEDGHIFFMSDAITRVIIRATHTYAVVLFDMWHPENLKDGLKNDAWLDQLRLGFKTEGGSDMRAYYEIKSSREGDIPAFYTKPNSKNVFYGKADQIAFTLALPTIKSVKKRINMLSEITIKKLADRVSASLDQLS